MEPRRILVLQGHPDPGGAHLGHALADTYAEAARVAGHDLRRVALAGLDVPLLRSADEWHHAALPASLQPAQDAIGWCQHLAIFFPLWMGEMPALLKAFLEQVLRPGFAVDPAAGSPRAQKALAGRSARIVVTMGMPSLAYRVVYRAHSVKALERNILGMCGIAPIRETLIGSVETADAASRARWFRAMQRLGAAAD
jgi:putative NADPH-quinone reductase